MYVIGTNEWNFLKIKSRTMMGSVKHENILNFIQMMKCESCKIWNEVEMAIYDCDLYNATIFPNYDAAAKIVAEIKKRKDGIMFENSCIIGQILDKENGKEFDVDELKVYELVPTECKMI